MDALGFYLLIVAPLLLGFALGWLAGRLSAILIGVVGWGVWLLSAWTNPGYEGGRLWLAIILGGSAPGAVRRRRIRRSDGAAARLRSGPAFRAGELTRPNRRRHVRGVTRSADSGTEKCTTCTG